MSFAADTTVPAERSRAEIDKMLQRAGATQRMMGSDDAGGFAFVVFGLVGRQVRLRVPLPKLNSCEFDRDGRGSRRTADARRRVWEQACRARWRALVLLLKAKLEAISLGLSTPEREFLADIFLPDGRTVYEFLADPLKDAYLNGKMPPLLGPVGSTEDR